AGTVERLGDVNAAVAARRADARQCKCRNLAATTTTTASVGLVIAERAAARLHVAIHHAIARAGGELAAIVEAERTVRIGCGRCRRGAEVRKDSDWRAILVYRDPGGDQHGRGVGGAGRVDHRRHVLRSLGASRAVAGIGGTGLLGGVALVLVDQGYIGALIHDRIGTHGVKDAGDHVHL